MTHEKRSKVIKILAIVLIGLLIIHAFYKKMTGNQTKPLPTPTVIVQSPKTKQITAYVTQTGTLVAYNSVNLVARIEGYLDKVEFVDGAFVKKGQELFVVEPQPYMDQLKGAQASVEVQKSSYTYSLAEYKRQQNMYKQNATSLNEVEKWAAKTDEFKAEIAKAEANADSAAINYSYTHILSPFDGRIGRHLVDPGNLVGNGKATDLATIEQIDPIYVYFNLNELDLIKLRNAAKASGISPADLSQIPVYVAMQNETDFPHQGKLNFVNTGLNASTGTMEFRALLPNKNYALLPGLFVQIRIPLAKPVPQLTVPNTAIQYDQIGPYVYTVDKNNVVNLQRVQLGALDNNERAILKGITATDTIIVGGLQNATPGNQVKTIPAESASPTEKK